MTERYLIIADDITGSTDTGAQLKRHGIEVIVTLNADAVGLQETSYVLNTESRPLTEEESFKILKNAVSGINLSEFDHVIKKVDSTLRGNIAHEISAIDKYFNPQLIIFMPALPDMNRTTENGVHMLNNIPISKTEIAKDPRTPVSEDCLAQILRKALNEPINNISISTIEKGIISFSNGRIFTCDSITNTHMQIVISAALSTSKKILWVGSAAILDNLLTMKTQIPPAMALVASLSQTTQKQIIYARNKGLNAVVVPTLKLINNEEEATKNAISKAIEILSTNQDIIVMADTSENRELHSKQISPCFIQKKMGEIALEIINKVKISGVFVSGGDTAMGLLNALNADGLYIVSEVLTGIPMSKIVGGKFKNLKIVTKAGAFGQEDALLYCLRKIKEHDPTSGE